MWLRTKEAGTSHLDSSGLYVNVVEKTRGEGALGGGWNQSRDVKLITFPYQPMRAPRLAASLSLAGVGTDARLSCGAPDGGRGLLRRLWPVSCHSRSRRLGGGGGRRGLKRAAGELCIPVGPYQPSPRSDPHRARATAAVSVPCSHTTVSMLPGLFSFAVDSSRHGVIGHREFHPVWPPIRPNSQTNVPNRGQTLRTGRKCVLLSLHIREEKSSVTGRAHRPRHCGPRKRKRIRLDSTQEVP